MKRTFFCFFAALFVFCVAGKADATTIWANGVTESSGWLDADKDWIDDTLMCWAASAANMLSWGDWDGGAGLVTEDQILDDFTSYWNDRAGNPYYGVEWWFNGTNYHQGDSGWAQLTDFSHIGFYADPLFDDNYLWTSSSSLIKMGSYLDVGCVVSIRIENNSRNGHFLTLWGVDSANGKIWVTDSDKNTDSLDTYTVTGTTLSDGYSSWNITSFGGIFANTDSIDPILRDVVPEPSTLLLLGLGILGFTGISRRNSKFYFNEIES